MQTHGTRNNAWFIRVAIALVLFVYYICPGSAMAAICEIPILDLFPQLKMAVAKEGVLFYVEPLRDTTGFGSYGFEFDASYFYDKHKGLIKSHATKQKLDTDSTPEYIKVGGSFTFNNVQYKLTGFGIQKIQGSQQTAFVIPGIEKSKVESLLGYAPFEYWDNDIFNDPNVTGSEISRAIILGNKLVAGFGGGFPEGMGVPGGMAVFDFSTQTWHVEWNKDLVYLYVADIVPISSDAVWFSTRHNMEYQANAGGIFKYDLKTYKSQQVYFSDFEMWELRKWDDSIFMTGPEGITIYDLTKKRADIYLWNVDVDKQDRVNTELVKCEQQPCLFPLYEKLYNFYIVHLFEVKNKTNFLVWMAGDRSEQFLPGKINSRSWVDLPYCGGGLDVPKDFLKYIDVKHLIQKSRMRKSPMFWKTLSSLLKANNQEARYKQLIIDKANDSDGAASVYAKECLRELFPKEYYGNINPLKPY